MSGAAVQSFKKAFDGFDPGPDPRPPPPPSAPGSTAPSTGAGGERGPLEAALGRAERVLAAFEKVLGLMEDVDLPRNVIARAQASCDAFADEIEDAREASTDLAEAEKHLREETKAARAEVSELRATIRRKPVTAGAGAGAIHVFWTDIPGYDELGREERKTLAEAVAAKVRGGKLLFKSIMCGGKDAADLPAPTAKEITDLVWALKTSAQAKASSPEVGAIAVPNGAALRDYLDRSSLGSYPVASVRPPAPGQSARGIDLDASAGGVMMPAGTGALTYQVSANPGGTERLRLKLEKEGRYLGESSPEGDPTAPPSRPLQPRDITSGIRRVRAGVTAAAPPPDLDEAALYAAAKSLVRQAPPGLRAPLKLGLGSTWQAEAFLRALDESAQAIAQQTEGGYAEAVAGFLRSVRNAYGAAGEDEVDGPEIRLDAELG